MTKNSTFDQLPLSLEMKETLKEIGFNEATPIQFNAIPHLLEGRDLLGQAQTGTGKTAAFSVPLIEKVDIESKDIQALVVCPTRELCLQVCSEIKRLSTHTKGVKTAALYGGQAIDQQFKTLKTQKPQIIVATPGRLFDHLRRGSIDLSTVTMITLDEADEMLDMGFRDEIEQIFELLPQENQRIFFSATMPKAIQDLAQSYLRDPIIVRTEAKNLTVSKIDQSYFRVRGREKTELLCRVLDFYNPKLSVVFCNAKSTADEIVNEIKFRGFEAGVLHGDLSQNQRDRVMAQFRAGLTKVLVATDIAARGIDVDDVELVLNYHLPHDPEDYVHRIGRTGRAGRAGRAISLVEPRDNSRLRKITNFARADIPEIEPPTSNDVKSAKLNHLFDQVKIALDSEMISEYQSYVAKQKIDAKDMAAGLIKIALAKFDEHGMNDDALNEIRGKRYSGFQNESFKERDRGPRRRSRFRDDRPFFNDRKPSRFKGGADRDDNFSGRSRSRKGGFGDARPEANGSGRAKFDGRPSSFGGRKPKPEGFAQEKSGDFGFRAQKKPSKPFTKDRADKKPRRPSRGR